MIKPSESLDTYMQNITDAMKLELDTRVHMLNEGYRTQRKAFAVTLTQASTICMSLDRMEKHAAVGALTRLSHGLVMDQLIKESAQVLSQLIAIAHVMEQE